MRIFSLLFLGIGVWQVACSSSTSGGAGAPASDASANGGTSGSGVGGSGGKAGSGKAGGGAAGGPAGGAGGGGGSTLTEGGTPSLSDFCTAVVAAGCPKGSRTLADCVSHLGLIQSCSELRGCMACAGANPVVSCASSGAPQVPGCSCNIDLCTGGGGQEGGSPPDSGAPTTCAGANVFVSTGGSGILASPTPIPYRGKPMAVFGPPLPRGGYGELGGIFELTGLSANEVVHAQLIALPCVLTGCPSDLGLSFPGPDGGGSSVGSVNGICGSGTGQADANGRLVFHPTKTGTAGAYSNFGILFTPGGSSDAGP